MKNTIINNWNFLRFFRLLLGLLIIVQAIITKDFIMGILGGIFTAMPVFNIGCCGTTACNMKMEKTNTDKKEISYEEVV